MVFTYLTSFCEVRQAAKLPKLVEHYISHKIINHDISLYAFFKMHYLDEQIVDSDFEEDMNLPFKTHDFSSGSITINIPPEKETFTIHRPQVFVDNSNNFSYSEKFYPSVYQKIWEPPQI